MPGPHERPASHTAEPGMPGPYHKASSAVMYGLPFVSQNFNSLHKYSLELQQVLGIIVIVWVPTNRHKSTSICFQGILPLFAGVILLFLDCQRHAMAMAMFNQWLEFSSRWWHQLWMANTQHPSANTPKNSLKVGISISRRFTCTSHITRIACENEKWYGMIWGFPPYLLSHLRDPKKNESVFSFIFHPKSQIFVIHRSPPSLKLTGHIAPETWWLEDRFPFKVGRATKTIGQLPSLGASVSWSQSDNKSIVSRKEGERILKNHHKTYQ